MGNMPRWKLVTIGGHTIYLEPLFLLLVAFFAFSGVSSLQGLMSGLLWAPVLFIGVIFHELGHAIVTDKLGYGKSVVVLQGLGGVAINRRGYTPPKHGAAIAFAGPLFSFILAAVFGALLLLLPVDGLVQQFLTMMTFANLVWAVFNMLPIAPMDGGHIVLHGLRAKFPERKALLYSAYSSLVILALLAIPLMAVLSGFFVILLGLLFAMHNVQVIQALRAS